MLRYLTPRCPYDIQGPQTLAVAQISLTNYKQRDGGGASQKLFSPLLHPPHTSSVPVDWDRHPLLAADLLFALSYCYIRLWRALWGLGIQGTPLYMLFSKAELLGVFASFSFSSGFPHFTLLIPSLFLETTLTKLCIFPTILKETWYGRMYFQLKDVPLG